MDKLSQQNGPLADASALTRFEEVAGGVLRIKKSKDNKKSDPKLTGIEKFIAKYRKDHTSKDIVFVRFGEVGKRKWGDIFRSLARNKKKSWLSIHADVKNRGAAFSYDGPWSEVVDLAKEWGEVESADEAKREIVVKVDNP